MEFLIISPQNTETINYNTPILRWELLTDDGDTTSYVFDIKFGTSDTELELIATNYNSNAYAISHIQVLMPNTIYYWQVIQKTLDNQVVLSSDIVSFNTPPLDLVVTPSNNANNVDFYPLLSWTDNNNYIYRYDVYFGNSIDNLILVSEYQTEKYFDLFNVQMIFYPLQNYYWKIVYRYYDMTIYESEIFKFTTKDIEFINIYPENNQIDLDRYITLKWDINVNATYTYDIKLGTNTNNMQYIGLNLTQKEVRLDQSKLKIDFDTTYYWQIIQKQGINVIKTSPIYTYKTQKSPYPLLKLKRGTGIPPRQKLGEPLFVYDTGELYIGTGDYTPPAKISTETLYAGTEAPNIPSENDIWMDTSTIPYQIRVYKNNRWTDVTTLKQIGDLTKLQTNDKSNLVRQINEIYLNMYDNIVNFMYRKSDYADSIILSWKNPYSDTFLGYSLFVSNTESLTGKPYEYCYNNSTMLYDGLGQGNGNIDTYTFIPVKNVTYSFQIFQKFNINNQTYIADGKYLTIEQIDTIQPMTITDLKAVPYDKRVSLLWKNPETIDWQGTLVIRNTTHHPRHTNDGVIVQDFKDKFENRLGTADDKNLTNGVVYYYTLIPYDIYGNYHISQQNRVQQIPQSISFNEATNLTQASINDGQDIRIEWKNAIQMSPQIYMGRDVYISRKDIRNFTRDMCYQDDEVYLQTTGKGTGENSLDQIIYNVGEIPTGTIYYIKVFMQVFYNGYLYYSNGISTSVTVIDLTPPNRQTISLDDVFETEIKISLTSEPTNKDYLKTIIVRQNGTTIPFENQTVLTESEILQQSTYKIVGEIYKTQINKYIIDKNISIGNTYTYRAFQIDESGNANVNGNYVTQTVEADYTQVSNFVQDGSEELVIKLTWTDPDEIKYPNWQGTVIIKNANRIPNNRYDGMVVVDSKIRNQYQTIPYIDSNVQPYTTYYYRQFTYDTDNKYNERQMRYTQQSTFDTPPNPITFQQYMILHSAILFQWKDPVDSDWVFTRVVKKVGTPPLNPYDGELLYVESYIKNQYSSDGGIWFRDLGVIPDTNYYYGIFPADNKGTYNTSSQNIIGPIKLVQYPQVTNETQRFDVDKINIGFTLFTDPNTIGYEVYMSQLDLHQYDWYDCYYNNQIFQLAANTQTGGSKITLTQTNLEIDKTYYFKIFQKYKVNNIIVYGQPKVLQVRTTDEVPPMPLQSFNQIGYQDHILLTWENSNSLDYDGVLIRKHTERYPNSITDGELVGTFNSTITEYNDTNVNEDTVYYYTAFPYDTTGNYNISNPNYVYQVQTDKYVIVLENPNEELTDFQVKVVLPDNPETQLNIRNLDPNPYIFSNNTTNLKLLDTNRIELDYWTDFSNNEIWVKYPLLKNGINFVLIGYYDSLYIPDGDAVFEFFDDFLLPTLDLTKWEKPLDRISYTIENSQLIITAIDDNSGNTIVYNTNSVPYIIKSKYSSLSGNYIIEDKKEIESFGNTDIFTTGIVFLRSNNTVLQSNVWYDMSPTSNIVYQGNTNGNFWFVDTYNKDITKINVNDYPNKISRMMKLNNYIYSELLNGITISNYITEIPNSIQIAIGKYMQYPISKIKYDYVRIRKVQEFDIIQI